MTTGLDKRAWAGNDGELGALVKILDWSTTPLGSMSTWPQSLRTAVGIVLSSPMATILMWGPEHVIVYNSAYSVIAGERHPWALGKTVAEVWPEHWNWNRSVLQAGFSGQSLSYREQHFTVERSGMTKDGWFDLFYAGARRKHAGPRDFMHGRRRY